MFLKNGIHALYEFISAVQAFSKMYSLEPELCPAIIRTFLYSHHPLHQRLQEIPHHLLVVTTPHSMREWLAVLLGMLLMACHLHTRREVRGAMRLVRCSTT